MNVKGASLPSFHAAFPPFFFFFLRCLGALGGGRLKVGDGAGELFLEWSGVEDLFLDGLKHLQLSGL